MIAGEGNPTGITNYNIEAWARLPEWQALSQALNAVALAAGRKQIGNQDDLAAAVGHSGRPRSEVGPGPDGSPQIRTWPTGVGEGPFMALSFADFDAWIATVAEARADWAASRLSGELPSAHLGRTVAGA